MVTKKKCFKTKWRQEGKVSELNGDKNEIYIHKLGKLIKNIKKQKEKYEQVE